jgi:hypothetical protein
MTVEFSASATMMKFKSDRQKVLLKTAHMGTTIAALNIGKDGKEHVDTGASRNAKAFAPHSIDINTDTVKIQTGMDYDVYLERRFGIMARALDEIKPWFSRFMGEAFGK